MALTKLQKFALAIGLHLAILFFLPITTLLVLARGTEIALKVKSIDFSEDLSGNYATLQYDISSIRQFLATEKIKNGDTVYVVLQNAGKYWIATKVQKTKPSPGTMFIKGTVVGESFENWREEFMKRPQSPPSSFLVAYGIERYPVSEKMKDKYWTLLGKEIIAKVAINKNGTAALKQIFIGNAPWY